VPDPLDSARRTAVLLSLLIDDGDLPIVGLNTPLAAHAYLLAKQTHAPNLLIYSGTAIDVGAESGGVDEEVKQATDSGGIWGFDEVSFYPRGAGLLDIEAARPLQLDKEGRVNVTGIRGVDGIEILSGFASLAEIFAVARKRLVYVPIHSPRVFVESVDAVTSAPSDLSDRPLEIATDLGLFAHRGDGVLRLEVLWPGVDLELIQSKTQFPIEDDRANASLPVCPADDASLLERLDALIDLDPDQAVAAEVLPRAERIKWLRDHAPSYTG
jgi:acyl CoA:acetate/3-ketoacid CoA transferase beta subunit